MPNKTHFKIIVVTFQIFVSIHYNDKLHSTIIGGAKTKYQSFDLQTAYYVLALSATFSVSEAVSVDQAILMATFSTCNCQNGQGVSGGNVNEVHY